MNDKEFREAVFYNSDGIHRVRRYYTVEELYDISDCTLSYNYRTGICNYLKSINVHFYQTNLWGKEFLNSIGAIVDNKELIVYTLYFSKDCNVDEVEENIIRDSKMFYFNIKPLTAHIDLSILIEKKVNGDLVWGRKGQQLLPLLEGVIKPNDISNTASFMIDNLQGLYSVEKTVVITDNYLFPLKHDNQYEKDLTSVLESLKAKEIIHYGMKKTLDKNLFENVKSYLIKFNITLTHKDIDDFHDRFWITKETHDGLVFGTSLNGIGKKLCYYDKVSKEDAQIVLDYLDK
ncbi:MAG: hypothetical protein E6610_07505 [Clostridium perfringens]|nr:hypothetical protein [Clostridium perfringens]